MAPPTQTAGQKRKVAFDRPAQSSASRKRQKNQDARAISVQPAKAAVSANGELNVASFIKSREFEIGALEKSMQKARKALTTRAFQQVPRHMRRRTASHNAKKVPRRLRRRAEREMKEDNTPTVSKRTRVPTRKLRLRIGMATQIRKMNRNTKTVRQRKREAKANAKESDPANHVSLARVPRLKKNTLAKPPTATTKYKRRQTSKTWLPTHLWHTKRAHMTRPTEPLWRMALPLRPTEKSYRPSHRAAGAHGCIAWDASYMSTIACRGTEAALESLLNALGFSPLGLTPALLKKWKSGTRHATGWIHGRDNEKLPIAPVVVIWYIQPEIKVPPSMPSESADRMEVDQDWAESTNPNAGTKLKKTKLDHQILMRMHPSAFHQSWEELLRVAKMQKPQVLVEDLRFEIGSIEIQGPGSTESLLGVLRPFPADAAVADSVASLWCSLAGLHNPSSLPKNAMLAFDIVDPRLSHPPKQIKVSKPSDNGSLNELLVAWPPDKSLGPSRLTSHKQRWLVTNSLPSQKAINRRRALAPPGQSPGLSEKDPKIPVILLASTETCTTSKGSGNSQGMWTVLLPWRCVDPVWRSLMYYPLSSGGTPRFGGLHQKQQLAFEQRIPWFPGDFPGTEAGKAWERTESEKRFDEWIRRPPKNRIAWDALDLGLGRRGELGRGWTCDWEFLFEDFKQPHRSDSAPVVGPTKDVSAFKETPLLTQRQRKAAKARAENRTTAEGQPRRRNTSSPESDEEDEIIQPAASEVKYVQLSSRASLSLLKSASIAKLPATPALVTVRIMLLDKGTPAPAARVYRLPSIPRPAATTEATKTTAEATPPDAQPQQTWSSDPPAAQKPPPTSTTDTSSSVSSTAAATSARDLRKRWLALDDNLPGRSRSSGSGERLSKQKTNRSGLPRQQQAYPRESLARINVLPKNAPKEIVDKYGPDSAFGRGDGEIPKEKPPRKNVDARGELARKKGKVDVNGDNATAAKKGKRMGGPSDGNPNPYFDPDEEDSVFPADRVDRLKDLLAVPLDERESLWSKQPPCPDRRDLVGFVTSGGYNLAEGRGTAVGAVWAQRVVEGWMTDHADPDGEARPNDRLKRLCVVRNPGESVGRLGIWEVCGGV